MRSASGDRSGRAMGELCAAGAAGQAGAQGRPAREPDGGPGRHPRIPPWRRPIRRSSGEIQFGVSPGGAIVNGMSEAEARALAQLDGSLSLTASCRLAAEAGIPAARWGALLDLVDRLGVLEHDSCAGPPPTILLEGRGPLVDEVCLVLRRGGLDSLVAAAADADLALRSGTRRPPRPDIQPAAGHRSTGTRGGPQPGMAALAVLVGPVALDPRSGDPWLRRGVAHLPVVVEGPRACVGPLIEPALTGPCLWCLDLHRTDRDTSWPGVLAQVCGAPGEVVRRDTVAETDPALAHLVAGCITLFARHLVDGAAVPAGVSVEVSLPWPRMDHRRWTIHPHCRRRHAGPGAGVA